MQACTVTELPGELIGCFRDNELLAPSDLAGFVPSTSECSVVSDNKHLVYRCEHNRWKLHEGW